MTSARARMRAPNDRLSLVKSIGVLTMRTPLLGLASVAILAAAASGAPAGGYSIERQFNLGGPGGWDYLTIDSATHRLFISRADRVLVVNTLDGSLIATIGDTQGVHGIALAPDLGKGFTSNGRADSVTF